MNDTPTKEAGGPDQTGAPSTPPPCPICESPAPDLDMNRCREILSSLDIDSIERGLEKVHTVANNIETEAAEITQSGIASLETLEKILRGLQAITQWSKAEDWKSFIEQAQEGTERIKALEPFLEAELPTIRQQPGYEAATLEYLESYIGLDGQTVAITLGGQPTPPFILDSIERAAAAAYKAGFPTSAAKRADIVDIPLDKVNSSVWSLIQETTGRQEKLSLKAEKDGDEPLNIIYSIDFSELESAGVKITKRLTPFDKRVYVAIAALYNAGSKVISLTQIHYAMGNTGRPSEEQRQKINTSITKMRLANVFLDNLEESQRYNYPRFNAGTGYYREFYLLPVDRISAIINGQVVEAAIQVLKEPPLMTFARQRRQLTTITVKVLQSPLSKTDANLLIDDYLIERIAKAKRTSKGVKILYETLYKAAQITTKNQRTRAPAKIETYLKHYQACGLISRYSLLKDGIQMEF